MKRLALVTVLVALTPASASAEGRNPVAFPYTDAQPATNNQADALIRKATADVDQWWLKISGREPAPLDLWVYTADDQAVAYAAYDSGRVLVTREFRDGVWGDYTNRRMAWTDRIDALVRLWGLMAHERGHNLGLDHSDDCLTIMCPYLSATPWQAESWARKILPRRYSSGRLR